MVDIEWSDGRTVSTVWWGSGPATILLAHGAGTDQSHPMITGLARELAEREVGVVTFNYPYTEAGGRRPDRADMLLACHLAVLDAVRARHGEAVVMAGRSMGGRMATMLAADGAPTLGVVAYAYPLHPAGKPDRLRIDHLPLVPVPTLFFRGDRDALSRADLFDRHVRPLQRATVVDMAGADHSFRGRNWGPDRLYPFLAEHTVEWVRSIL